MPRGGSVFRNTTSSGWVSQTLTGTAASVTLTIPDFGTHLEIEFTARGDTAAATVNTLLTWNSDTTATNYFRQRAGASGNAAVTAQGNDSTATVMPANTAATGYFGFGRAFIPNFRNTGMARDAYVEVSTESSASNRAVHISTFRRTTAGSGALTDRISTVNIAPSAGNWIAGSIFRYRILP